MYLDLCRHCLYKYKYLQLQVNPAHHHIANGEWGSEHAVDEENLAPPVGFTLSIQGMLQGLLHPQSDQDYKRRIFEGSIPSSTQH